MASGLLAASALIIFLLGTVHLGYTFFGDKLRPRNSQLFADMAAGRLNITQQTTVWRAWLGFNASHSIGAILFGLIYAHLALAHEALLFSSVFLQAVGFAVLLSLALLARYCWFSIPFRGISLALVLYAAALGVVATR